MTLQPPPTAYVLVRDGKDHSLHATVKNYKQYLNSQFHVVIQSCPNNQSCPAPSAKYGHGHGHVNTFPTFALFYAHDVWLHQTVLALVLLSMRSQSTSQSCTYPRPTCCTHDRQYEMELPCKVGDCYHVEHGRHTSRG